MGLRTRATRALKGRAWRVLWGDNPRVPVAFAPGHFHSTIPSWRDISESPHFDIAAIDLRREEQVALLQLLDLREPTGPRYQSNGWFVATDAAIYQGMIRHFLPARVVEVGCGWSTAALFDAGAADHVTLIDPNPERVLEILSADDLVRCELIRSRLQDVAISTFTALGPGDVLFIDSTHVAKLGSDVNRILFEILPALASGVIIHFHDVFFPFEYPEPWVRDGWAWNEAYALRSFLEYNDSFEILLWAHMLRTAGLINSDRDIDPGCASIWLRKL